MNYNLCLALILMLRVSFSAEAAYVESAACEFNPEKQCITAIKGVIVEGGVYDVAVSVGSFEELFADPSSDLLYWGHSEPYGLGHIYLNAIVDALNDITPQITSDNYLFQSLAPGEDNFFRDVSLHLPTRYWEYHGELVTTEFQSWLPRLQASGVNAFGGSPFNTSTQYAFGVITQVPLFGSAFMYVSAVFAVVISKTSKRYTIFSRPAYRK